MKIEFVFKNLKLLSSNKDKNFSRKRGGYYKSTEKSNFQHRVAGELLRHRAQIFEFETNYSPYEHMLWGEVYLFLPNIMTKKGYLSKTAGDVNNTKILTDSIFKCFDKMDDSMLFRESSVKYKSWDNNHHIAYRLKRVDLELLDKWSDMHTKEFNL